MEGIAGINIFYIILFIVIPGMLLFMRIEAGSLKVEHVKLPGLASADAVLRVAQISDLHIGLLLVSPRTLHNALKKEKPDILIITGDFIEKPVQLIKLEKFLEALDLKKLGLSGKAFACPGNHDMKAFRNNPQQISMLYKLLNQYGITLLNNEAVILNKSGIDFRIAGLADLKWGIHNFETALEKEKGYGHMNTLVLCHNPDTILTLQKRRYHADWVFTGHFHGGQIWLPFHLEYRIFRREVLCREGITRGLHKIGNSYLYINRGLGCVVFPLRFLSPPELTVADLPLGTGPLSQGKPANQ